MSKGIILQGMTIEDLFSEFRRITREEIRKSKEDNSVYTLSKAEACRRLEITFPTLQRWMKLEGITEIKESDLEKLNKWKQR